VLANTRRSIPRIRANYAVRLGDDAARELLASLPALAPVRAAA